VLPPPPPIIHFDLDTLIIVDADPNGRAF